MNPRIRWVGAVMLVCFALLFVQLNNIQVRQGTALSHSSLLPNPQLSTINLPRGAIFSSDHKLLAYSVPKKGMELRVYPSATATDFGQITGYFDITQDAYPYGIEQSYNSYLAQHESATNSLSQLLSQHEETDNVTLTVSSALQADATNLLANHPGAAIIALDPRNGAVLAMAGNPSFDPNELAQLNTKAALAAYDKLAKERPQPFVALGSALQYG
ncbi:MAG: hypothetical protein ACRDZP_01690, partial [Acidimicrobiales bacterium]